MHHTHTPWVSFRRAKAVVHQLLGEENHVVHAPIEQACQGFSQRIPGLDDGLVVPHDDGMAVEMQGAKEDDGLDAVGMCGVKQVERLAASEHFPRRDERVPQPFVGMSLSVPDDVNAVVPQLQGAVEEMRRERSLFPFADDEPDVLGVIEVNPRRLVLPL